MERLSLYSILYNCTRRGRWWLRDNITMDLKQFGEQLKSRRQQAQLSQKAFVDALDQLALAGPAEDYRVIDGPLVSRWEHGATYKGRQWKPTRPYLRYLIRLFADQLDLLTAQQ